MAIFDIRDHGAAGDGRMNNAPALQHAIDSCHEAGGGTVLVPAGGVFRSGTIELRSNVELHVERGAVLSASPHLPAYTAGYRVSAISNGFFDPHSDPVPVFITAHDAENVAITGSGTIEDGGRHFILEDLGLRYRTTEQRPFTIFLVGCRRVAVRDVKLCDAALWCLRLTGCEDVMVHGVTIDTDMKYPNADGIDLDRCRRARISDCEISCGDDAISLKACEEFDGYGPTTDIVITGCTLRTTSNAVVVGVEAAEDIRDVIVSNCVIRSANRGLSVNLGQGRSFSNILFSDCIVQTRRHDPSFWGHAEPIYVNCGPWHPNDKVGQVRNVRFTNILARGENGAYIGADAPGMVEGILLDGVRIEVEPGSDWPGGEYDRRPTETGPEVFAHPTAGIYVDTASDVTLRDCEVAWTGQAATFGHALEAVDVQGLVVEGLRGTSGRPGELDAVRTRQRAAGEERY